MNAPILSLILTALIIGGLIFVAILLTQKRGYTFDVEAYQTDFLKIENSLIKADPNSYTMAVVNADKLLDKALCEMGVPGKTMGERLKKTGSKFTQLNSVWYAHKLRNQIAHEHHFEIEFAQAKHAVATYKQALKDLGAI